MFGWENYLPLKILRDGVGKIKRGRENDMREAKKGTQSQAHRQKQLRGGGSQCVHSTLNY